jgi:thiol-disulfide isomerase/thioredoxin
VRRTVLAAVAVAALLLAGCGADQVAPPGESTVDVDTPALRALKAEAGIEPCRPGAGADGGLPDVTLSCLGGGQRVDLASLRGPLVLNFWQSSCGPCRKEMPALQDFHERYGDRVPVLGVDYLDTMPQAAMELARRSGVTYPLLADPGGELQATAIRTLGVPYFVFLDADGTVTRAAGGVESAEELRALVREHLDVSL